MPVSRVDSGNTHGFFARVYRAEWVGPRSFADRQYGGREEAEAAALEWVKIADTRLPVIPSKPVLMKATVHLRTDPKEPTRKYYDVYTPKLMGDETTWSTKFYFNSPAQRKMYRRISGVEAIDLTTNEQAVARQQAYALKDETNARLQAKYKEALIIWYVEHDRIMQEIGAMWDEIKTMPLS